jgi:low temperature requirement protein LtrA
MKPEEGEPGSVPMIRPPRLHLGREGAASRLELFFDLAYVLVIMQLAVAFVEELFGVAIGDRACGVLR